MTQAEGQEVLVIDGDVKVQKGMEHLLRAANLTPTVIGDPRRAVDLAAEKFFAVALVDLDTPSPDAGVNVVRELRARAPKTAIVALAPRRAFDAGVAAFRVGADDVILKTPDQVDYLRDRVVSLAAGQQRAAKDTQLVESAAALHEEMMKALLDTFKRGVDLEESSGADEDGVLDEVTTILLVEEDGWLAGQLGAVLDDRYELEVVSTGGEALDAVAGAKRFQIALVKDHLPDLPGSMVVRTMKQQSQDTLVLLFAPPVGGRSGSVQVIETSRTIPFLPAFTQAMQLAERLGEIREAFRATSKERRYLGAFRQQHFELLKRYAELKQRLQRAKGGE